MSDWEQAVQDLFRSHPRSISSKTVIEAINSARKSSTIFTLTPRDLAAEQNRSWNFGHERGLADAEARFMELLSSTAIEVPTEGLTERDSDAMNYALAQLKLKLAALIKGEKK